MTAVPEGEPDRSSWTFLTNHGHVLVCVAQDPGIRGRDIAARVGITERAAQAIIADLVSAGYVQRTRIGRRNHYEVNPDLPVRHPVEQPHRVGDLLAALAHPGAEPSGGGGKLPPRRSSARRGDAETPPAPRSRS